MNSTNQDDNFIADFKFKILTIGDSGVGKTSILRRYAEDTFTLHHIYTIGVDFKSKNITYDGKNIGLKIWDTAGQERFKNLNKQYYKNSNGIMLVFDINDMNSFEALKGWMHRIREYVDIETVPIVLIGNKCDLQERQVLLEDGQRVANEFGIKYFETSACKNINIENAFLELIDSILKIEINKKPANDIKDKKVNINEKNVSRSGCC